MASNDPHDWLRKLRNTIKNNIETSKASHYSNAFSQSKGKSRKTWQTINELTSRKLNGSIISRSLRDSVNKVIVPFPRTNFVKNSFSYSGAVLWNSLPGDMTEAKSLTQFKRLAHLNFCFLKYCTCTRHS